MHQIAPFLSFLGGGGGGGGGGMPPDPLAQVWISIIKGLTTQWYHVILYLGN